MKNITKIIRISRPLHKYYWLSAGLIMIGAVLAQVSPILSKFAVDGIVLHLDTGTDNKQWIMILIGLMFVVNIVEAILQSLSNRLGDHTAGELGKLLYERFYRHILGLPQAYFDGKVSGRITNQLNRGIRSVYGLINTATNFILPSFLQTIITVGVMAYYSVPVALFAASLFPIFFWLTKKSTDKWGAHEEKKNKIKDETQGRVQEVLSNIKLVRGFGTQRQEWKWTANKLAKHNEIFAKQSSTFHWYDFARNLSLNIILILAAGVILFQTYEGVITLGTMVLLIQLFNQVRRPLFAMSFIMTRVQEAESGSKEYFEVMALSETEPVGSQRKIRKINQPVIEFKRISFRYSGSERVLKKVSFKTKTHEKLALVGPSGAGKTTLINLILKFYEPTEGEILMNEQSYQQLGHEVVRGQIALVFQEAELFSTTVAENIAYGTKASEAEIRQALERANALSFVDKLPQGIKTEVGERGIKLSGGQKQRIQIARAILRDAPILILDEATSHLDSRSERAVQIALETLMQDRLVIIIAHRLSTIQDVDRILVLDEGQLVAKGSPVELANRPGVYADLLKYQVEGNRKLLEKFEIY